MPILSAVNFQMFETETRVKYLQLQCYNILFSQDLQPCFANWQLATLTKIGNKILKADLLLLLLQCCHILGDFSQFRSQLVHPCYHAGHTRAAVLAHLPTINNNCNCKKKCSVCEEGSLNFSHTQELIFFNLTTFIFMVQLLLLQSLSTRIINISSFIKK